jgi:cell division protein FtsQ
VTAAVLMAIVFGFFFSISGFFTVDSIEVEGNDHYTSEEIINMAHAVPGRNLIYHTNKTEIIDYLEQNPYIKSADVVRKLPSTLLIVVNERTESMAFKYDDEYLVMDSEGILLRKSRSLPLTTLVEGMIVNKIKLGEVVGTEDKDKANKAIKLISSMTAADLYFVKVDMSNNKRVKAYIYDNLLVRADYDTMMTNINNGHLHKVVENLFEQGIKRGTITFDEDGSASFMPII